MPKPLFFVYFTYPVLDLAVAHSDLWLGLRHKSLVYLCVFFVQIRFELAKMLYFYTQQQLLL